jgi:uncharacterized coiled-coil protein SlyX
MLIGMKKIQNDDGGMVTKKMFQDGIGELAILINKSFVGVESRMGEMESRMATKDDLAVLTKRVDRLDKYMETRFDGISNELKEIRKEIKTVDTRAKVFDLQARVTKLEKKAAL